MEPLLGNNWSVGGAMALTGNFNNLSKGQNVLSFSGGKVLPNSSLQISNRIAEKGAFQKGTIVTYMTVTNNMWYSLYGELGQTGAEAAAMVAVDIRELIDNEAETIIVSNIPDFSAAPWLQDKVVQAEGFIRNFNQILESQLKDIEQANPTVNIVYADAYTFYKKGQRDGSRRRIL